MLEAPVEDRLKSKLEDHGFKVLKLVTPGQIAVMDRLILRPTWSPGAPYVCETKRPGKELRRNQELLAEDWTKRGVQVLKRVTNYDEVDKTVAALVAIAVKERIDGR